MHRLQRTLVLVPRDYDMISLMYSSAFRLGLPLVRGRRAAGVASLFQTSCMCLVIDLHICRAVGVCVEDANLTTPN